MKYSFLICGNLNFDTYSFYCSKYPSVKKVFCTWKGNCLNKKWKRFDLHSEEDIFLEKKPPKGFEINSLQSQIIISLLGLEKTGTEFVIKLRGDEWYSNLNLVAEAMMNEQQKIFILPVLFRSWEIYPFHLGMHMLAGRSSELSLMYSRCAINLIAQKKMLPGRYLPAECYLCKSYLDVKKESSNLKNEFKNLFEFFDLEYLKYYKISDEKSGRAWYSNFNAEMDGSWERSISSMNEI